MAGIGGQKMKKILITLLAVLILGIGAGGKKETNADICASVTGNAGPSKGDPNEPVGRVYVGLIVKDDKPQIRYNFKLGNSTPSS